jgi:asparagine synthase (glutamine-hydrolysing)
MCGIAGFVDEKMNAGDAVPMIGRMLENIAHRGPDARMTWIESPVALGHNRLSIIDLSVDGNQPMHGFDAVIVFNGELYNYLEVRAELIKKGYHFNTQSDTEVILAAYREYGTNCVNHFVGMWAFALWDKKEKILFCSTDRFGIKPFYYLQEGSRMYFGSEYKALKPSPLFSNKLNLDQVSRGLQLGWVCYEDETYYESLKLLPAAHNLVYRNGKIEVNRYWDIHSSSILKMDLETCKHEFRELMTNSIEMHMRSDVEIAICLSGGIDSSSLTGLIAQQFPSKNFKSYSIYYEGKNEVDERPFMKAVTDKFPSIHPNYFQPSKDNMLEKFHEIMHQVDVPATGSSNISHYFLMDKIHQDKIKVVVDGQGADEYLAGYMHSMYRYNADCIRSMQLGKFLTNYNRNRSYQDLSFAGNVELSGKTFLSLMMNEMQLFSFEYKHYYPFLVHRQSEEIPFNMKKAFGNSLNNFLYHLLFHSSLPTILHYVDRMTMAHSVESRVPFLDHRLVEYAFAMSNDFKINKGITKYLLRESVKDILPEKVYNRRDKKGFVTPGESSWLRGPLKHLLDVNYGRLDFLDKEKTKKVIEDYEKGNNKNARLVWRIATLNYWINNVN